MNDTELQNLIESLYIPKDDNLDAICLDGTWYIETCAGNLDTARSIKKHFDNVTKLFTIQLDDEDKDYLVCYRCTERIVYGKLAYWCGQFYHDDCWDKNCEEYYK